MNKLAMLCIGSVFMFQSRAMEDNIPPLEVFDHKANATFDSCVIEIPTLGRKMYEGVDHQSMGAFSALSPEIFLHIFSDEEVIKWLFKNHGICKAFKAFSDALRRDWKKILTKDDHRLEVYDQSGAFSIFYRGILKNMKTFNRQFAGHYPHEINPMLIKEDTRGYPRGSNNFLGNSTKVIISYDLSESVFEMSETDMRPETECKYFIKLNKSFIEYFKERGLCKHINPTAYTFCCHKPNSMAFTGPKVMEAIASIPQQPYFDLEGVSANEHLRGFYNRHGIIISTSKYSAATKFREEGAWSDNRRSVQYMNAATMKFEAHEIKNHCDADAGIMYFMATTGVPKMFCLIITFDRAFLNGEPATIIERDQILPYLLK
jgi:hypothetical protein